MEVHLEFHLVAVPFENTTLTFPFDLPDFVHLHPYEGLSFELTCPSYHWCSRCSSLYSPEHFKYSLSELQVNFEQINLSHRIDLKVINPSNLPGFTRTCLDCRKSQKRINLVEPLGFKLIHPSEIIGSIQICFKLTVIFEWISLGYLEGFELIYRASYEYFRLIGLNLGLSTELPLLSCYYHIKFPRQLQKFRNIKQ